MWGNMGPSAKEWKVLFLLAAIGAFAVVAVIIGAIAWMLGHLQWVA